ncbi:MAG: PorV/PorQ family protein [Deferribacteres bacterium]|nr:PorV/PorQ family protein [candidate division KSB1 bacterium]MCB9503261.1 PorV/PorQ family protein [Deferribacteres bacterium]
MSSFKKLSILSFGLFLINLNLYSQNTQSTSKVGTTAAQFLKIGAGARSIGLGGAYVGLDQGIEAIYWNPACIARIPGSGEAVFNHANWLAETDYDFAAFSVNTLYGTLGLQLISFRIPEEKVRTVLFPEGTGQVWDANSLLLGLTFARSLTDHFAIGLSGKYIHESIFNEAARTLAVDLGIFYQTPWPSLKLGASITNFGGKMKLDGRDIYFNEAPINDEGAVDEVPAMYRLDSYEIPLGLRFGIAWQAYKTHDLSITVVSDAIHPNDNKEYINSGLEMGVKNIVFLRGGYRTLFLENSEQDLAFGIGLRYDAVGTNFRLDFGWSDYGRLQSVKFVTLSVGY